MPETTARIVHVNDVAGVASAAVAQARAQGLDWDLWPLPAVRGAAVPVKIARRVRDIGRFRRSGRGADLLHVHYGLFGYYAWSVHRPYVLHLHGTDVRANLRQPLLRHLVTASIRYARAVIYSTPDLRDAVTSIRGDARWVPAPLSADADAFAPREPTSAGRFPRVVFASRWDPVKGLDVLLDAAAQLRRRHPDAELIGVDWGVGARRAELTGVRLQPVLPASGFRALLASADVVVGQQSTGMLGIADLEAMALGRPLVARFSASAAYGGDAPLWNTELTGVVAEVESIIADPAAAAARAREGRAWALRHHSAERFVATLRGIYGEILASGS